MMSSHHDGLRNYIRQITKIPVIPLNEEGAFVARLENGDEQAVITFISRNLRLVVKIAHDFKGLGVPLQDLISEGNLGLMHAVGKYDITKGTKFSSYAVWWIKQAMRKLLMENGRIVRIPTTSAFKINKIRSTRAEMSKRLDRDPTDAEMAEELDYSERIISRLKNIDARTLSLHEGVNDDDSITLNDMLPDTREEAPDQILDRTDRSKMLERVLRSLSEREYRILLLRFGLDGSRPRTLDEVSNEVGVTRERVRQIQKKSLQKLRTKLL